MKVIDLLNKIARGEEVPKKIKYNKKIYEYQENSYDYLYHIENNSSMLFLFTELFNSSDNVLDILNYEVKIIEEDKKIEKLEIISSDSGTMYECIAIKINEIIDKINGDS